MVKAMIVLAVVLVGGFPPDLQPARLSKAASSGDGGGSSSPTRQTCQTPTYGRLPT